MAKKKGPGRPRLALDKKGRGIELYLKLTTIETAKQIGGNGNASRGVEIAVREYSKSLQQGKPVHNDHLLRRIRKILAGAPTKVHAAQWIEELLADNQTGGK